MKISDTLLGFTRNSPFAAVMASHTVFPSGSLHFFYTSNTLPPGLLSLFLNSAWTESPACCPPANKKYISADSGILQSEVEKLLKLFFFPLHFSPFSWRPWGWISIQRTQPLYLTKCNSTQVCRHCLVPAFQMWLLASAFPFYVWVLDRQSKQYT